jgi:chemotaxis protein CheD
MEDELIITEYLKAGDVFSSRDPAVYKTVLGSCISVCLFDTTLKMGAMNHFIYADSKGLHSSEKYGDVSMKSLINHMMRLGSNRKDLIAGVYGGASGFTNSRLLNPGLQNIDMAMKILKQTSIPVVDSDTGGHYGRKVLFHTDTNEIKIEKLNTCMRIFKK